MLLSILAEPLKNSEIVTISLWIFGIVGTAFLSLFGVIGWLAKDWFAGQNKTREEDAQAFRDSLYEMSLTIKEGFTETFTRIRVLETFKAKIEAFHPINHPNQDFHD